MSHFTSIEIRFRDVEALRAACTELGLSMQTGGEARGYAGQTLTGEHIIKLPGPYDIALRREQPEYLTPVADLWQGHVEKVVGKGFARLKQLYGVHYASMLAARRGLSVQRSQLADGRIRLALNKV